MGEGSSLSTDTNRAVKNGIDVTRSDHSGRAVGQSIITQGGVGTPGTVGTKTLTGERQTLWKACEGEGMEAKYEIASLQ